MHIALIRQYCLGTSLSQPSLGFSPTHYSNTRANTALLSLPQSLVRYGNSHADGPSAGGLHWFSLHDTLNKSAASKSLWVPSTKVKFLTRRSEQKHYGPTVESLTLHALAGRSIGWDVRWDETASRESKGEILQAMMRDDNIRMSSRWPLVIAFCWRKLNLHSPPLWQQKCVVSIKPVHGDADCARRCTCTCMWHCVWDISASDIHLEILQGSHLAVF